MKPCKYNDGLGCYAWFCAECEYNLTGWWSNVKAAVRVLRSMEKCPDCGAKIEKERRGMQEHVCSKCGKQLEPINWWTASIQDRFGEGFCCKLCKSCALDAVDRFAAELQMRGDAE